MSNSGPPKKPKKLFLAKDKIFLPGQEPPELSEIDTALLEFDSYMNDRLYGCADVMIKMLGMQHAQLLAMKEALGVMPNPTAAQIRIATERVEGLVMKAFGFGKNEASEN